MMSTTIDTAYLQKPIIVSQIHINGIVRTDDKYIENKFDRLYKANNVIELKKCCEELRYELIVDGVFKDLEFVFDLNESIYSQNKQNPIPIDVYFEGYESRLLSGSTSTNIDMNGSFNLVVGMKINNINGRASKAEVNYIKGSLGSGYNFIYNYPITKLPYRNVCFSLFKKNNTFGYPSLNEVDTGLNATYSFPSKFNIGLHSLSIESAIRDNTNFPIDTPYSIRKNMGYNFKTTLKHVFISDGRNDNQFPTKGGMFRLLQELVGLGSTLKYFKNQLRIEGNISAGFYKGLVLAGVIDAGVILPIDTNNPVATNDKFFLGGPYNIKGFQINSIGPKQNGYCLGGDLMVNFGAHAYFQLPFIKQLPFLQKTSRLHLFTNAGYLQAFSPQYHEFYKMDNFINSLKYDNWRLSCGIGLAFSIMSNVRMELNIVKPLLKTNSDIMSSMFSFGAGIEFN